MAELPRIAYFMQCAWGWAWQRPHVAAIELARGFEVDVYVPADKGEQMVSNPVPDSLKLLPYIDQRIFFRDRVPEFIGTYDVAWFCGPAGFSHAREKFPAGIRVVYDYMDDTLLYAHILARPVTYARLWLDEIALVERSDLLFASSGTLAQRLVDRYQPSSPAIVVNNAAPVSGSAAAPRQTAHHGLNITYVGTVASWFDFPTVLQALDAVPEAVCHLVGPLHVTPPAHPRLKPLGPQTHARALELMQEADLLVMPRVVDSLTETINPVKLYEYIQTGIPVVAVAFGESRRFAEFVYLYENPLEFTAFVRSAAAKSLAPKGSRDAVAEFLRDNSWEKRGIAWRNGVSEVLSRTISRPAMPHLAYQRKQLSRIVGHMEKLSQRGSMRARVGRPGKR